MKNDKKNKIFSFKVGGKTKPVENGQTIASELLISDDGTITIVDKFNAKPKSFRDALYSPTMFSDVDKYLKNLKEAAPKGVESVMRIDKKRTSNDK